MIDAIERIINRIFLMGKFIFLQIYKKTLNVGYLFHLFGIKERRKPENESKTRL